MKLSPAARKWVRGVVDYGGLVAFLIGFFLNRGGGMTSQEALVQATWWLVGGSALGLVVGLGRLGLGLGDLGLEQRGVELHQHLAGADGVADVGVDAQHAEAGHLGGDGGLLTRAQRARGAQRAADRARLQPHDGHSPRLGGRVLLRRFLLAAGR